MLKNTLPSFSSMHINSEALIAELHREAFSLCSNMDEAAQINSTLTPLEEVPSIWERTFDAADQEKIYDASIHHYNYFRIFLAYLMGAVTIAEIYKFTSPDFLISIQHIQKTTQTHFQETMASNNEALVLRPLLESKGYLIDLVAIHYPAFDKKTLNDMLDQAKDWVGLAQPTPQVLTKINLGEKFNSKSFVILDTPCTELTEEQKNYFSDIHSKEWFHELPTFQQNLVLHYKDRLLSGKNVVPSQLRKYLPFSINMFRESIFVNDNKQCKELNTYFHCGSMAYLSHGNEKIATEATQLSLLQKKMHSGANAMVSISLNSVLADSITKPYEEYYGREYSADDSAIIRLASTAAAKLQTEEIYFAKICLNGYRSLEFNNYIGIDELIKIIRQNIKECTENEIAKKLLEHIAKLENLQRQFALFDYEVKGLDIIYCLTKISMLNNQLAADYPAKKLKTTAVFFGCASGENRTGITYFNAICQAIIDYLEQEKKSPLSKEEKIAIYNIVADSGQTKIMTDLGGTLGTQGIRSKSQGSFKPDHPKHKLITKTSDMKKLPPNDFTFNITLDKLQEALSLTEKNSSMKSLRALAQQLLNNGKALSTEIAFLPQEIKKIHQDSLFAAANLLSKPQSTMSDLEALQLKIKKINEQPASLITLNDLLSKLSAAAAALIKSQTASTSWFNIFYAASKTPAETKSALISSQMPSGKIT